MNRVDDLVRRLNSLPRARLAVLPTPLEECPRLSAATGGPRILVKRDDLTGLAFGGNKTRHLEFHVGRALSKGANVLITCSTVQSNHCRQTAAAAARLGMKAVLVLKGRRPDRLQGNTLLYQVLGADFRFFDVATFADLEPILAEVSTEYARRGYRPYVINTVDGSPPEGAVAYVECVLELLRQSRELGVTLHHLVVSSCGGTLAGLLVGVKALRLPWRVIGVSPAGFPIGDVETARRRVVRIAQGISDILGLGLVFREEEVEVYDNYVGPGYGVLTEGCVEAIHLAATLEGLILDPVYTGKAMAGLIDLARKGVLGRDETVVFVHTGGLPALFAYADELFR